jgi:hypothetical protein
MGAVRSTGEFHYRTGAAHDVVRPLAVREASPSGPAKPKLLDRLRDAIRTRHYSQRTEKVYVHGSSGSSSSAASGTRRRWALPKSARS